MSKPPTPEPDENLLTRELRGLREEVRELNNHRYIRIQNSIPKMMGYNFLRGLAVGLGTVIGASVLVSALAFFLAQIDFIPIVGEWASRLAEQIAREVGQGGSFGSGGGETTGSGTTAPAD